MGVKLKVWGEFACFTRPEMKAERVSYDVMTPSAARGILEAILWKPAIRWEIDRIHVLNDIRFQSIKRNEVNDKCSATNVKSAMNGTKRLPHYYADDSSNRAQRSSLLLHDVAYIIEAHFVMTDEAGETDDPKKFINMFNRRARDGQCFHRPYLGCREFDAHFELVEDSLPAAIDKTSDLGWMFYDWDFGDRQNLQARFFRAELKHGVVEIPPWREVIA